MVNTYNTRFEINGDKAKERRTDLFGHPSLRLRVSSQLETLWVERSVGEPGKKVTWGPTVRGRLGRLS